MDRFYGKVHTKVLHTDTNMVKRILGSNQLFVESTYQDAYCLAINQKLLTRKRTI